MHSSRAPVRPMGALQAPSWGGCGALVSTALGECSRHCHCSGPRKQLPETKGKFEGHSGQEGARAAHEEEPLWPLVSAPSVKCCGAMGKSVHPKSPCAPPEQITGAPEKWEVWEH